jgi:hypothetical protein
VILFVFSLYDDKIATCSKQRRAIRLQLKMRYIQCRPKDNCWSSNAEITVKGQLLIIGMQVQAKGQLWSSECSASQRDIVDHRNAVQAKGQLLIIGMQCKPKGQYFIGMQCNQRTVSSECSASQRTIVNHRNAVQAKGTVDHQEWCKPKDNCLIS